MKIYDDILVMLAIQGLDSILIFDVMHFIQSFGVWEQFPGWL